MIMQTKEIKLARITLLDDDGETVVTFVTDNPEIIKQAGSTMDLFDYFAEVILGNCSTDRP